MAAARTLVMIMRLPSDTAHPAPAMYAQTRADGAAQVFGGSSSMPLNMTASAVAQATVMDWIEGEIRRVVRSRSVTEATLAGTTLEDLKYPLLENKDEWVLHGFSFANYLEELGADAQSQIYAKSSIDLAMRDAFRKVRHFLIPPSRNLFH